MLKALPRGGPRRRVPPRPGAAGRAARTAGAGPSCARPERLEVEVALDQPQRVVVDDSVVAEPDDGLALGDEHGIPDRPVVERLLLGLVRSAVRTAARFGEHVAGLMLELLADLLEQRQVARIVLTQLLEPPDRRLGGGQPGVRLLGSGTVVRGRD